MLNIRHIPPKHTHGDMHKQAICSTPVKTYMFVTIVENNILNITHIPTKRTHDNMQNQATRSNQYNVHTNCTVTNTHNQSLTQTTVSKWQYLACSYINHIYKTHTLCHAQASNMQPTSKNVHTHDNLHNNCKEQQLQTFTTNPNPNPYPNPNLTLTLTLMYITIAKNNHYKILQPHSKSWNSYINNKTITRFQSSNEIHKQNADNTFILHGAHFEL